jgi:hypothetical protein
MVLLPALPLLVGVIFVLTYFGSGLAIIIGLFMYIYGLFSIDELDQNRLREFITNRKVYAIVSLLLVEWSLANVTQMFFVFITNGPVVAGQAYIFPFFVNRDYTHITSSFPPIIILELILFSPELDGNLLDGVIRILGFGLVIFTLGYFLYLTMETIQSKKEIQVTDTQTLFWAELSFIIALVGILTYEIIVPIWAYFDPRNPITFSWTFLKFLSPSISIFFLTFLLTGAFSSPHFVIGNTSHLKSRLIFGSIFGLIFLFLLFI